MSLYINNRLLNGENSNSDVRNILFSMKFKGDDYEPTYRDNFIKWEFNIFGY